MTGVLALPVSFKVGADGEQMPGGVLLPGVSPVSSWWRVAGVGQYHGHAADRLVGVHVRRAAIGDVRGVAGEGHGAGALEIIGLPAR